MKRLLPPILLLLTLLALPLTLHAQTVGWRGDGTGRFPDATPPLQWSRQVKGITSELKYQAKKPVGEPGADSRPLEYFTIKDFLVAGPFPGGIDDRPLGPEASIQPNENDKAAATTWKPLHVSMDTQSSHAHNGGTCKFANVDFVYAFGTFAHDDKGKMNVTGNFKDQVAYAHTYLYAPNAGKASLLFYSWGSGAEVWLNGQPVPVTAAKGREAKPEITFAKGWNRLLVKVSCADALKANGPGEWVSGWRFAAYITPSGSVSYETKNIVWMTKMTGVSISQPITVGDKLFLNAGMTDLVCISKTTGKILWINSNMPYTCLEDADKSKVKGKVEPLLAELKKVTDESVAMINAGVSPQGMTADKQEDLDKKLKVKEALERKICKETEPVDPHKYKWLFENEVSNSNPTPCSDGTRIFSAYGGGHHGQGSSVVVCYDLAGKRLWSYFCNFGTAEHGSHASPILIDGKLIHAVGKALLAFDPATGKLLWEATPGNTTCSETPTPGRISGTAVVWRPGRIVRVSDGATVCQDKSLDSMIASLSLIIEKDVVYNPAKFKSWSGVSLTATKLPDPADAKGKATVLWETDDKNPDAIERGFPFYVASPLYVNGIVYGTDESGRITAMDAATGKFIFCKWPDNYNRYERSVFGCSASPTLGGKYIFQVDASGCTTILESGPQYKEAGRNILENIQPSITGMYALPCNQECFYTSPYFEGPRIYLRGQEYLYCIGKE